MQQLWYFELGLILSLNGSKTSKTVQNSFSNLACLSSKNLSLRMSTFTKVVSHISNYNFCIWRKFGTVQIFRELAMPNFGRAQWPTAPGRAPRSRPFVAATWPTSSAASVARPTAGEPCSRRPRALPRPWLIISCAARGSDGRAISRRPEAPSSADWPPAVIASRQRHRRFCRALTRQPGA